MSWPLPFNCWNHRVEQNLLDWKWSWKGNKWNKFLAMGCLLSCKIPEKTNKGFLSGWKGLKSGEREEFQPCRWRGQLRDHSKDGRAGKTFQKLLSKFPFPSLIVLERLERGKGGFGVYSQEKKAEVVRGRSFGAGIFPSWCKISSLGQQLLIKTQVCVEIGKWIGKMNWEIGKMEFPKELQDLAELHPSWLSQIHSQAQGIFNPSPYFLIFKWSRAQN